MTEAIISATDLSVHFPLGGKLFGPRPVVRAVEGVTVHIQRGSFFGLVGESGSGKTTFGRALLRAAPITRGGGAPKSKKLNGPLECGGPSWNS